MILLDTSVLSRVFRRRRLGPAEQTAREQLQRLINEDAALGLPGIVLQEILSGIRSEKQFLDLAQKLLASFTIVHPTTSDHLEAARLKNRSLAAGRSPSALDCLIAAMTISGKHELFAADQDFVELARLAPLKLYSASSSA